MKSSTSSWTKLNNNWDFSSSFLELFKVLQKYITLMNRESSMFYTFNITCMFQRRKTDFYNYNLYEIWKLFQLFNSISNLVKLGLFILWSKLYLAFNSWKCYFRPIVPTNLNFNVSCLTKTVEVHWVCFVKDADLRGKTAVDDNKLCYEKIEIENLWNRRIYLRVVFVECIHRVISRAPAV